ncbi:unnamed protein product [Bursaphelenchus okinawaensis]|uniref:Uncharacterized protein n=1 Tax=Bursaphelenchus okinawaensis TaxID=465554 RepID=A0A811KGR6_9BILA|nr:unnamed protein product [Bursaphelenchus okinawaensis]CAG9102988.1 unnamed protein product [Bursaphelenchus okinawaensis]
MKSAHTWHRSHNAASLVREAKAAMTAEKTLETAKEFLAKLERNVNMGKVDEEEDEKTRKMSKVITNLCNELEKSNKNNDENDDYLENAKEMRERDGSATELRRRLNSNTMRRSAMGSQIFSTYPSQNSLSESENEYDDTFYGLNDSDETVKVEEIYRAKAPWFIRAITHILFFLTAAGSVYGGAILLQAMEPEAKKIPLIKVILNCFDAGARIGWGAMPPISTQGRIFMTFYNIYIASLVNALIATIGSAITNIYCIHWPVLVARLQGKDPKVHDIGYVMSIKVLLYFNVIMILFGCVMTMMAAAFGDVHPDPQTHGELIVLMLYFLVGIAIWSGILVILTHYVEIYYIEKMRDLLRWIYLKYKNRGTTCEECDCKH